MIFKPIALLASLSIFSMASAWEIFMYESTAGGDPDNCNGGGTTVSGTGSVCQLAAPNTVAMQVINDPEGCECKNHPRLMHLPLSNDILHSRSFYRNCLQRQPGRTKRFLLQHWRPSFR
ncbi:hypothetical protein C8R42DRAFT_77278 [Lentinula raphanica]|nr:hypothetical protein C8R42DRAFT_77278 [Lentinula raphanica]